MSLVGYKAKNHPQQVEFFGADPEVDDRALPQQDFEKLNERFRFTIDAAASDNNAKLPRYWTIFNSGLLNPWTAERVYCNPPYSSIKPWIDKASKEKDAQIIVMLLPANRTEQGWWQTYVEPYRDRLRSNLTVEFLPGRQRFIAKGKKSIGPNERPPFGLCLCIWENL